MSHSFKTKLQDNAESIYTSINKAVLTLASIQELFNINTIEFQSFTICHLHSQKQNQKWVYFNILLVYLPLIVFFIYMFIYFWRFV